MEPIERLNAALAGRYRIERELGAGGMATVYLAEDLRHRRQVAVKVLRPDIARALGPDRFLREIATTAQLTHPHILPLLDSGDADGALFYVMPFVEGESLRQRLAREKQLPLEEAVRITVEIADALGYAHGHGVVHRDIKPENVLLESGHAVVADFGIARAIDQAGGERLTETGVTLGTPAYMSPEQATGSRDLDGRSDVYSLACILYEMLAAETPYTGPTPMAIMARKLADPLPRISVVRETVPRVVESVLAKALARLPADRYATAGQFAEALAHAETTGAVGATPTQRRPIMTAGDVPRWGKWAAGVAAVAVIALLAGQLLRPKSLVITASDFRQITSDPGAEFQPAISPDGKEVAFVAGPIGKPHLVIRSTASIAGEGEARTADTSLLYTLHPSWSPDGGRVRFLGCRATGCSWNETGKMGGAVRLVPLPPRAEDADFPAWSPDGSRVAFVRGDTIFVSSAADTTPRVLAIDRSSEAALHSLAWSPDGRRIAYVNGRPVWQTSGNVASSSIRIVSAEGGPPIEVAADEHRNVSPAWLDDRHLLFVSDRDGPRGVYVVEVGPHGRRGEPRLVPGIPDPRSISYSVSTHTLAYAKFTLRQNIWSYPLGRAGPVSIRDGTPVTSGTQVIEEHDISPDGRWLAFNGNRRGTSDIYKVAVEGGDPVQLTSLPGDEMNPRWSPDGREIVFDAESAGVSRLKLVPAHGGTPSSLTSLHGEGPSWAADGRSVVFASNRTGQYRAWIISRDSVGGAWKEERPFNDFPFCEAIPRGSGLLCWGIGGYLGLASAEGREIWRRQFFFSSGLTAVLGPSLTPDGRTIYVTATHRRDGRVGVWALPLNGGDPRLIVASDDPALSLYSGTITGGEISFGRDHLYLTVSEYESDIWVAKLKY